MEGTSGRADADAMVDEAAPVEAIGGPSAELESSTSPAAFFLGDREQFLPATFVLANFIWTIRLLVETLNAEFLKCWTAAKMRCTDVAVLASVLVRLEGVHPLREETTTT